MKIWNEIWDYVKMIIIVVVVVLVINNVVLINAKIPSESMENTIMTGDRIFGYRLAYGLNMDVFGHEISKKWKDPERFDIVIFFDISCPKKSRLSPYARRNPKIRSPVIMVFSIDSEGILALISTTLFTSVTITTTMMIIFA